MRIISSPEILPLHLSLSLSSTLLSSPYLSSVAAQPSRRNSKGSFYEQWWKTLQILINTKSMLHSTNNSFLSLNTTIRNHTVWPVIWTRVVIGVRPKPLWPRWPWYNHIHVDICGLQTTCIYYVNGILLFKDQQGWPCRSKAFSLKTGWICLSIYSEVIHIYLWHFNIYRHFHTLKGQGQKLLMYIKFEFDWRLCRDTGIWQQSCLIHIFSKHQSPEVFQTLKILWVI